MDRLRLRQNFFDTFRTDKTTSGGRNEERGEERDEGGDLRLEFMGKRGGKRGLKAET